MSRIKVEPRPDYQAKLNKYSMFYYDEIGIVWAACGAWDTYWSEKAYVKISGEAAASLRKAAVEIHGMMLEAIDEVIADDSLL